MRKTKKNTRIQNRPPVILERPHHPISRKEIDADALKVLYRLYRKGFKGYLVGGAVRDFLLGKIPKDFDVATDARPGQIKKLFANCFLIGRRFRLAHIRFKGGKIIEVATFRREPEEASIEGIERNNTFGTPKEDAFRRDITINALFYDISNFSIIDYVGGLEDIRKKRVCIIGDPQERYTEDPVRMWRVLRHAARNQFTIEDKTADAILAHRDLLSPCAGSRLFEELNKDIVSGFAKPVFRLFHRYQLLPCLFGQMGVFLQDSPNASEDLLKLLSVLDRALKGEEKISQVVMFTLLFWPWARHVLSGNTVEGMDRVNLLHDAFSAAGMSIIIPKGLRANVIQTIFIMDRMFAAMNKGRMRWSLKRRARYMDASVVFSIIEKGEIPAARDPFAMIFKEKFASAPGRARGKMYRRRYRPQKRK